MKRIILYATFFLLPVCSKAQFVDTTARQSIYEAGRRLKAYSTTAVTGMTVMGIGLAMVHIGSRLDDGTPRNSGKPIRLFGYGLGIFGFGVTVASFQYIKNAGVHMTKDGIAIDL